MFIIVELEKNGCQKKYTFSDTKVLDNVYYILYNKVDKNRNYIKFITVVYKNKHI